MRTHLARWILVVLAIGVGLAAALGPGRTPPAAAARMPTIAAGYSHTCAVRSDGSARCWGYNNRGQLGDNTKIERLTPVPVSGLSNAVAIAAASYFTCAVRSDGSVRCWGDNAYGQLGDGTTTDRLTPVPVNMNPDTDGDRCTDAQEAPMGFDSNAWYDFFDVPVPAYADPTPCGPRNKFIDMSDVIAVLFYAGAFDNDVPNANGVDYDSDKNGDTVEDGRDYDRSPGVAPNPPWEVGPPNGAIDMGDVLAALAQVGLDCSG